MGTDFDYVQWDAFGLTDPHLSLYKTIRDGVKCSQGTEGREK